MAAFYPVVDTPYHDSIDYQSHLLFNRLENRGFDGGRGDNLIGSYEYADLEKSNVAGDPQAEHAKQFFSYLQSNNISPDMNSTQFANAYGKWATENKIYG